jgi:beta-lactamase regulating signal transducer with metallopeptidase domain/Skp family chaperone for outer membrane proteins
VSDIKALEDADTVWAATAAIEANHHQRPFGAASQEAFVAGNESLPRRWPACLAALWLAAGLLAAAIPVAGYVRFVCRLRPFAPAPGEWAAQWEQMLREAGVSASIPLLSSAACGPLLCRLPSGYVVIVPRSRWEALTARQRAGVLRHELAHYERSDIWKSVAARLLAWPQWFNPFIWHALRRFDECAEQACDERVRLAAPEGVTEYALALLELTHPSGRPALASAAGGRGLAARVRRLLSPSERKESRMKTLCVCMVLIVLTGLGAVRPGSSAAYKENPSADVTVSRPASAVAGETDPTADAEEGAKRASPRHSGLQPADDEAYVDMKRLFDEEPGFKAGREQLKRSLAEEAKFKKLAEMLQSLHNKARTAGFDPTTTRDERQRLNDEAKILGASIEVERESRKNLTLEREAELYRVTYERIRAAVADYARDNGIRIVRRKQAAVAERLDAAPNPQDMIRLLNQDVIFNSDEPRDITDPVLELLKARAKVAQ